MQSFVQNNLEINIKYIRYDPVHKKSLWSLLSQIVKDDRKAILSNYLVVVVALMHSEEVEVIGFGVSEPRRSKTLQEAGSHVIKGGHTPLLFS